MTITTSDYKLRAIIVILGILTTYIFYFPNSLSSIWNVISNNTISLYITAFLGGFSAGIFTYYFNSKSRLNELRHSKYFEHRNTIVQIEHELISLRVNLSRDIESVKNALEVKSERYRFIMRFFNLDISSGLSLKLLDINFINKYSELYIILQSINSDIEYLKEMVTNIQSKLDIDNPKPTPALISLMDNYLLMINHLNKQLHISDRMSLELVAMCEIVLSEKTVTKLNSYIKNGGEIKYSLPMIDLKNKVKSITNMENKKRTKLDPKPQFVALYFDLVKVKVQNPMI